MWIIPELNIKRTIAFSDNRIKKQGAVAFRHNRIKNRGIVK